MELYKTIKKKLPYNNTAISFYKEVSNEKLKVVAKVGVEPTISWL